MNGHSVFWTEPPRSCDPSEMPRSLKKSNAHFKKAVEKLPLGVSSNFRYWGDEKTIYIRKGRGARLWDFDDNEYIDYRLAYGPVILGYADPRVDAAARDGMEQGGVFALSTERELTVADRISKMVPAAERIRFSNSGTEAVMAALRVARAYTGKDSYVVVEGAYHGVFDAVLWYVDVEDWNPEQGNPEIMAYSEGVPEILRQLFYTVPLNDANALEDVFKKHRDDIGAFLIEPIMGNCCSITADVQYMKDVRALCDKYEIVLIIDEVKTGFRVAKGGVQELMSIKADICTFAKAMANGYPISVVAGRADIMNTIGERVVHGGTFTAHSVSIAAAEETLRILDETKALADIESYGRKMQLGISEILNRHDIPHTFIGHPAMGGLVFDEKAPKNYRDWVNSDYTFYDALAPNLHEQGVLCEPDSREPLFICEAHNDDCLAPTLDKFETALQNTLKKVAAGPSKTCESN